MTDARNQAITPRADAPFAFFLNGTRFFPGAGTTLRFAANAIDALEMPALPPGMVSPGDEIVAKYLGTTVFRGEVAKAVRREGRGVDDVETVSVEGPWGKLSRMPYLQTWKAAGGNGPVTAYLSRVVLNRSVAGVEISTTQQIEDVADFAAAACGFAKGSIAAGAQVLPADETRDITCGAAILRTLRFFPRTVCRFDYSANPPALNVMTPGTTDAAWLSTAKILGRDYERTAHPVVGVVIHTSEIEYTAAGGAKRTISGQSAGVTDSIDTLHVTMPLAPPESSQEWEQIEVETEDAADVSNPIWWLTKHPRLKGVSMVNVKSYGPAERSDAGDEVQYAKITNTTIGDLERFGFHGKVVRWTFPVTLDTGDEVDEQILLTLDYVTTDCNGGTYKRVTGSSAMAGETLPEGLAAAILAQRAGELMGETVTIRLGAALPMVGDVADGLVLQEFTVDCYELTAQCRFGRPAYLAPEDMRDLLNGFRQRGFAYAARRDSADPAPEDAEDVGGVQPLEASDWKPGTKAKTTIKSASGGTGGSIVLDSQSENLGSEKAEIKQLTFADDQGNGQTAAVLATANLDMTAVKGLNDAAGKVAVIGGDDIKVETEGRTIRISYQAGKAPDADPNAGGNSSPCHPGDDGEGVNPSDDGGHGGVAGGEMAGGGVLAEAGETHGGVPCTEC